MTRNLLYSFRRCPYAMRARLALKISGVDYDHREIVLRDKPASMIAFSPKATVPVFVRNGDSVLDESLDIMFWALGQSDPEGWLDGPIEEMKSLIAENDGPFKRNLDRYKYPTRYPDEDCSTAKEKGLAFIASLEDRLFQQPYLFGRSRKIADMAIFPFVRQFSKVDADMFPKLPYPNVQRWLASHLDSDIFKDIMKKHPLWKDE